MYFLCIKNMVADRIGKRCYNIGVRKAFLTKEKGSMNNLLNAFVKIANDTGVIGGADGPTAVFVAGEAAQGFFIAAIVIGLLFCLFGNKIMRVIATLAGFCAGAGIGVLITQTAKTSGLTNILIIFGCAIALTALSFFVFRIGIFITALGMVSAVALSVVDVTVSLQIIIALAVTLVLAILAMIFMEPVVIIITALAGGFAAGNGIAGLAGFTDNPFIGLGIGAALAVIGMIVQFMMQSRKVGKKERLYSRRVKEKDSMESEVEKAKMFLDDDDLDENSDRDSEEESDDDLEVIEENLDDSND